MASVEAFACICNAQLTIWPMQGLNYIVHLSIISTLFLCSVEYLFWVCQCVIYKLYVCVDIVVECALSVTADL